MDCPETFSAYFGAFLVHLAAFWPVYGVLRLDFWAFLDHSEAFSAYFGAFLVHLETIFACLGGSRARFWSILGFPGLD